MFATLLDPAAFAADREGQRAHALRLGGLAPALIDPLEGDPHRDGAEILFVECPELSVSDATLHELLAERLTPFVGLHRAIIPVGGNLVGMSREAWRQIPAESLVINPIRDPESWRAAATWPGDRGLILALVPAPGDEEPEPAEILLWAVRYAASLGGRGLDRVAVAGMLAISQAAPNQEKVEQRIVLLERLVHLASASEQTLRAELDSRAFQPIERPRR